MDIQTGEILNETHPDFERRKKQGRLIPIDRMMNAKKEDLINELGRNNPQRLINTPDIELTKNQRKKKKKLLKSHKGVAG